MLRIFARRFIQILSHEKKIEQFSILFCHSTPKMRLFSCNLLSQYLHLASTPRINRPRMPNYFNILFMLYTKASYESSNHSDECKQILARKSLRIEFQFPSKIQTYWQLPLQEKLSKGLVYFIRCL